MNQRLVEQLIHIQQSHGELWGIFVKKPLESSWCDPPIPNATKAWDAWESSVSCHVWTESSQYANAWHDFGRLCPSLLELAVHCRGDCVDSLKEKISAGTEDDSIILRWLWFVAGFAVAKLPGRTPRTNRKCWGMNGHFFVADKLETQRKNLPTCIAGDMPPDASCWLVRVDDIIQTSIEAVEYLASTQIANGIAAKDRPKGTFAIATDVVPDAYKEQGRECGPLEGTKTMLARVVTKNQKAKPDDLEKHHGHGGKVFVRQIRPRKLEVFFRSFKEFNAAKDQLTSDNSE